MKDLLRLMVQSAWGIHEDILSKKKKFKKEPARSEIFRKAVVVYIALAALMKEMGYTPLDVEREAKKYEAEGKE